LRGPPLGRPKRRRRPPPRRRDLQAAPRDAGEWTRLRSAEAARTLLNVSSELVDLEDPDEPTPTNDNGAWG
jgi:hypothetical protein